VFKSELIYAQINQNSFDCWNLTSGKRDTFSSKKQFSSNRLAIADFEVAADVFSKATEYSKWKYFLKPKPTLIMHQRYNSEDLSPVEVRILQELSLIAGSRETFIWQGAELSEKDIKLGVYKNT
jgi:hypothetical protein